MDAGLHPIMEQNDTQPSIASIYHLYRFKRKFTTVCSLISQLDSAERDRSSWKSRRIDSLQNRIELLRSSLSELTRSVSTEKKLVNKKRVILTDRIRYKTLYDRRKQLKTQKENLDTHLNNEKINLRIKNAYLKSLRQQYLHALLTDVFPIMCVDMSCPSVTSVHQTKSVVSNGVMASMNPVYGAGIESTLLSSVAPSALNQDQFTQLDEAIHTHYLGQGFWTSADENESGLRSESQYRCVFVSTPVLRFAQLLFKNYFIVSTKFW